MLCLLLQRNRFLFLSVFSLFLFANLSSALEIGVAPAELNLNGGIGEILCKKINIFSDEQVVISIKDMWNNKMGKSRILEDYKFIYWGDELILNYSEEIQLGGNGAIDFCLIGKNEGEYYGVLLFEANGRNVMLGSWVNVVISDKNKSGFYLTGMSILEKGVGVENAVIMELAVSFVLLLILLLISVSVYRRKCC